MTASSSYRRKALDHYGEVCQSCGEGEEIEVHHLDGDRNNGELENLLPLCRHCHSKLHRSGLEGLENQLLPIDERSHIDQSVTSFKISVDCGRWDAWKDTVPRSKSLEKRIIELIEADTEGRVQPREDEE